MEKYLFVIYTPYQLISAINIINTYQYKNIDFFLINNNLQQFKQIALKQIDGKMINADYLKICNRKIKLEGKLNIFYDVVYMKNRIFKEHNIEKDYTQLFVPSDDIACRVIYKYLRKYNKSLELNLYDDGIGTYTNNVFSKHTILGNIVYSLFLNHDYCKKIKRVYCYNPQLIEDNNKLKFKYKILKINNEENTKELFRDLVKKSCKEYIGKKIIFLDQGLVENIEFMNCLKIAEKFFDSNEIVIKKHPRIESNIDYSSYLQLRDGIPIEMIINSFDFSNAIIISAFSTGCLAPYYLLDSNYPYAIMLYKIKKEKFLNKLNNINKIIEKINLDKELIFLPEDYEDFENYLKKIYKMVTGVKEKNLYGG